MTNRVIKASRKDYYLRVDATTSILKDHNSFDYETTTVQLSQIKINNKQFQLNHKFVHIFRNQITFQVFFLQKQNLRVDAFDEDIELLGIFQIRYVNYNIVLRFYQVEDLLSDSKHGAYHKQTITNKSIHHIYIVVRSLKNQHNESIGYKLMEGSLLKIGQKQYFISSVCSSNQVKQEEDKTVQNKLMLIDSILNSHKKIVVSSQKQEGDCKYCMTEEGCEDGQFLCSPCKCSGSCGLVHFNCLQKWNQSKVKKNQVKGLTYYNFQKFFCEVCKDQYPKFMQKNNKIYELMPIQIPQGQHLILQQIDIKCSSLICIENIPLEGIRMGRGNQCQIRVDSPSISRNHARIMKFGSNYFIFDNKSKFGTTVRDNKIYLDLDFTRKGVQIDRTIIMFQICKKTLLH